MPVTLCHGQLLYSIGQSYTLTGHVNCINSANRTPEVKQLHMSVVLSDGQRSTHYLLLFMWEW